MADSTLTAIKSKVRKLTRSPSTSQLSEAELEAYINTFVLYDLPEHLRLFTLRKTLTFYTTPNVSLYETSSTATHPLYNFKNIYNAVYEPIYVAGYRARLTQTEDEFYALYPFTNAIVEIAEGDGVTTAYTGTLTQLPFMKNKVVISSVDSYGAALTITDDGAGTLAGDGTGTINYLTGAYSATFTSPPGDGEEVNAMTVPYVAAKPDTILFFNNVFELRPIPDKVYPVQIEVDVRPTELLSGSQSPDLEQWWQYIAYGAAKKIFEDRTDIDSVKEIMEEFKNQEILVNRRTINMQSKERTKTIYSSGSYGHDWGNYTDGY